MADGHFVRKVSITFDKKVFDYLNRYAIDNQCSFGMAARTILMRAIDNDTGQAKRDSC